MKLAGQRIDAFVKKPDPGIGAVLVYGPDTGLVKERAAEIARSACPDLADPFRVAELSPAVLADDPARLSDEMAAMSLTGGRRVVRVREATDTIAPLVKPILEAKASDTLLVVEAGDLPARSALRKLFEAAPRAAALPCYLDGIRDLAAVVRETLSAHRITAAPEALEYLTTHLGGDRLQTRSELEKLALYVGDGGRASFEDAVAAVGDAAALDVEDIVFAAFDGDVAALDRALSRALAAGEEPVSVLRAAMRHGQRLQIVAARLAAGNAPDEALRTLRPPVFFKHRDALLRQARGWGPHRLGRALAALTEAEINAKRTVLPQDTICREALLTIARAGRKKA